MKKVNCFVSITGVFLLPVISNGVVTQRYKPYDGYDALVSGVKSIKQKLGDDTVIDFPSPADVGAGRGMNQVPPHTIAHLKTILPL